MLRYKQRSKFPCAPASNPKSSLRTKFFWIKQHLSPSGIQLIELNHLQQASDHQRGIKTLMSIIWNRAGRLFRVRGLLSFSVTLCSKCLQDFVVAFLGRYRQGGRSHRWPSRSAGSTCFLRSAAGRWCHSAQSRYCCLPPLAALSRLGSVFNGSWAEHWAECFWWRRCSSATRAMMMMMKMTAPDATPANRATSDPAAPTDSPLLSPDSPFCMGSGEREFMIRFSLLFVGLKPNDCESKMSSFTHVNYLFIYFVHKSAPVIYIP